MYDDLSVDGRSERKDVVTNFFGFNSVSLFLEGSRPSSDFFPQWIYFRRTGQEFSSHLYFSTLVRIDLI